MVLAVDVYYKEDMAKAVGVLFDWDDNRPCQILIEHVKGVKDYVPGEFYRRELPSLLEIIKKIDLKLLEVIIVDGNVYTNDNLTLGLGGILWEALHKEVPVIGIAKTAFFRNKQTVKEVLRGESKKPLYVSTIGFPIEIAVEKVKSMRGDFRIPNILKQLDTMTKED